MKGKQTQPGKQRTASGEKILAVPGIGEAMDLVKQYAYARSVHDAIEEGGEGRLGEKALQLIEKSTPEAFDEFLELAEVAMYIDDIFDEWLETLAVKAGPKIAELWNLSDSAGQFLSKRLYWGPSVSTEVNFSPILLANIEDEFQSNTLKEHYQELRATGVIIAPTEQIMKGHIYLDVTELPYQSLRSAYKGISLCRKYLGIEKKDILAGAPSKIDTEKALEAVYLKSTNTPNKQIARELGFKIYSRDNPSGSYPLLHKYHKRGNELEEKLIKLDNFLFMEYKKTHS